MDLTYLAPKRSKCTYKVCPHCNRDLSIKKYKEHRRLFFDEDMQSWVQDFDTDLDRHSTSSEFSSLDDFEIGFGSSTEKPNDPPSEDSFEDPLSTSDDEGLNAHGQGIICT